LSIFAMWFARSLPLSCLLVACGALSCAHAQSSGKTGAHDLTAPGKIEPVGGVLLIGTAASGTIAELPVHPGDKVAAGQILVRLACAQLENEVDAKTARLAAAEAALTRLQQGPRPEDIIVGTAEVAVATARADEAAATLRRAQDIQGNLSSEAEVAKAKRDADMAAGQLAGAKARLAALHAGAREEDIKEVAALRDAAKADAAEAAAHLAACTVRAPQAGIVLATDVTPGQFISAAVPQSLVKMGASAAYQIRAEVDVRNPEKICLEQHAEVTAPGVFGVSIAAVTRTIGPMVTRSTMTTDESGEVREVILVPSADMPDWPVGLRVFVHFAPCAAG
jgi:multidrug efflux pump subunit AcrA (membrane-fusion protein)